jgi:hypothetical protein
VNVGQLFDDEAVEAIWWILVIGYSALIIALSLVWMLG